MTHFLTEPGCTPSRAALNTGRYAHRSGLGTIIVGGTPNTLLEKEVTIAELFKTQGYSTAIRGKWHLGSEEQSWPTNQGFDDCKVGVIESSDGTLYRQNATRANMPEEFIEQIVPGIWEGDSKNGMKKVKEYTIEYRQQVEADISQSSVEYIKEQAMKDEPFFLYVGWTHSHYPSVPSPEFKGKSTSGVYGDVIMELDYRTGQVLDAIDNAGIRENTIVLWISDDGAASLQGPAEYSGGSNGIWAGELGDAREGSLRTPAMIRWPNKIKPSVSNEMVSIHDILPTLANIIGAVVPTDRPIDGVDQTDFFLGNQENSNREDVITFIGTEIVAVRWRNYVMYPKTFVPSPGNRSMPGMAGNYIENNGYPSIFNLGKDPREQDNILADNAWMYRLYFQIIGEYKRTLTEHPNPPAIDMLNFE
jgi:arylsulfatase